MQHKFDIQHAIDIGIFEAIILEGMIFWISKNKANKSEYHFHEGRYWTFDSINALCELYPYLTYKQIRSTLDNLINKNVLMVGNFNKRNGDRTRWFAFVDEDKFLYINKKTSAQEEPTHAQEGATPAQDGAPLPLNKHSHLNSFNNKEEAFKVLPDPIKLPFDSKDFEDAWNRWLTFNKEKRKKLPPSTIKAQLKKLNGFGQADAIESIDRSICNNWAGLFEPDSKTKKPYKPKSVAVWVDNKTGKPL